ncbi:hypothetical protein EK0264_18290 [Epidermidibacterium keratini]|uniref:DUF4352 domain-containing protein n=1 Tax=Epidermidibacterium keratini TaxID=1891644 RepID=A0A7L4YSS9_9ACTN|nr:hypothetical protein [Epidermidibacterium keratini]QHC02033.1 hypothetical protein EK0264_18290 [Epidermidibacterium keratini]
MRDYKHRSILGASAVLLVVVVGACGPNAPSTTPSNQDAEQSRAPDNSSPPSESADQESDGDSGSSDAVADCAQALEGTSVGMGEKITCDGWTVTVTDFQENVPLPTGVELQDQYTGDAVDSSTTIVAATVEVSTIGEGPAGAFTDFAWALSAGGIGNDSSSSTDPLYEVEVGSTSPGDLPEPKPVDCLVEGTTPCSGQVYFEIEEDMDMSAGNVYVYLHSPTDESMGSVQVK